MPSHTITELLQIDGTPVDIGFLVYNEHTYPNLMGLFEVSLARRAQGV
jgi:predicted NAD/FAD-binding protein